MIPADAVPRLGLRANLGFPSLREYFPFFAIGHIAAGLPLPSLLRGRRSRVAAGLLAVAEVLAFASGVPGVSAADSWPSGGVVHAGLALAASLAGIVVVAAGEEGLARWLRPLLALLTDRALSSWSVARGLFLGGWGRTLPGRVNVQ